MSVIGGTSSWNMAVTAAFGGFSLPDFNNSRLMMIVRAHDLALALITLSAPANAIQVMRFKLSRAGVNLCSRPHLRISDE